jgi:hypothetical protein
MGFGNWPWPSGVDKVTVAFDRYLILSGYWQHAKLRWVLLFDLKTDQILLFNRDVPAASTVDGFGVTEDGRTLVQLNFGGQLRFTISVVPAGSRLCVAKARGKVSLLSAR